jgi:hypothetical protein
MTNAEEEGEQGERLGHGEGKLYGTRVVTFEKNLAQTQGSGHLAAPGLCF